MESENKPRVYDEDLDGKPEGAADQENGAAE